MINPVAQGYGVQPLQPPAERSQAASKRPDREAGGDTVSFSEEALQLSRTISSEPAEPAGGDIKLIARGIPMLTPEELADKTEKVGSRVTALLLENDIPTDPPVELFVDEAGAIRVQGDHPYKDEIEEALAGDASLGNDFRQISAQASLQKAMEEHTAFAEAYEEDPDAAVARFSYLFDQSPDKPYTMTIGGEEDA
ncbi:hypothetical protein BerOc1_02929 [Pseudodesulfovibrio hydrargyri]|uniref:Uncharacterized protein n=1 Tax=Pseudodesulfovibrio hydrargyri TaxID=2125990 RepID=A0A1J5N840_9BACT|nr:hypothetical protein [Pseudodesulfovibrio hydrargyri]OIQ50984.1 hypothetical protein BerOc1_02929 [Pseudodesulfovibrio hydrargyri]